MSKICIVGTSNLKHISLISLYTCIFDELDIPYDVVYTARYGIKEKSSAKRQYCYSAKGMKTRLAKIKELLRFRRFTKKIIKKNKYDFIITWQTTCAYLFFDILFFKFNKRYIVNIRDYVIENNKFFYFLLKLLVKNSAFSTISSEGFLKFLPPAQYVKVNSVNLNLIDSVIPLKYKPTRPYKIGFAGNCRYFNESYRLVDALKNDDRFELWFCGTNSDVLAKYAECHNIQNVKTMPAFDVNETINIMERFDIVNSAFGNDAMDNRTLLPIRLYLAAAICKPTLANEHTQLASFIRKYSLGFVIKEYSTLADELVEYFDTLNGDSFCNSCNEFLKSAKKENEYFCLRVRECIGM